jgi:PKD repeat protein
MRLLTAVCLALFAVGCGVEPPTAPASVLPKAGEPATIELSATPGIGEKGGTATITARVLDGLFTAVPNATVTFAADAGQLASQAAQTDDKGIATTTLTASPGAVKVTAIAGSIHAPAATVAIQPVSTTSTPPPSIPPPPVPTPPETPLTATLFVTPAAAGADTRLSVATGPIVSAVWTFGDNTPSTTTIVTPTSPATTTHRYAVGPYTASVTVTDARGRTASDAKSFTIGIALPASYTVALSATLVVAGGSSTLTATVTQLNGAPAVTSWAWDCDNNGTIDATSANTASCTYLTEGPVTARVTVTGGAITGTATTSLTVAAQSPIVTVNCAQQATPALTVECNVSATLGGANVNTTDITHVDWDWADTTTTASPNALGTHTYLSANTRTIVARNVTITGTTAKGSGSATVTVQ